MRVLHICPGYLQRPLYDKLISTLQSTNIVNEVLTLSSREIIYNSERPYNLQVLVRKYNIIDRLIYFGKQRIIYKRICTKYSLHEFNLVHAHTLFSSGFSGYLLHKEFGLPYIVTIRNTDINVFFKYMFHLRYLGRKIMYNAKNIIFLSSSYRDFVINKYFPKSKRQIILDKSVVIPNGIDEYFLDNKFLSKRTTDIKFIKLIYIGEINSNKNIETTIRACKLLLEKGYTLKYTIVGEILKSKYHKIIAKYGFIDYYPKCSKEELVLYLRDSDIFILPSIHETFGLVYAEAMSQGLPVIYSEGQGFDRQFENGVVGYAVNSFDYRNIMQKIIDLYDNYQQVSERCITLVEKFKWSAIANEYKKIYS
jgi:glycosyltransferase involved in cell wall biosynthesis